MSALPPKADMCGATSNVRFGPEADITGVSLFDQLVCELLEMKRYLLPQRFGGLEVDNKLILRRRLYQHVGWLLAALKVMSALTPKAAILPYAQKGLAEQNMRVAHEVRKLR